MVVLCFVVEGEISVVFSDIGNCEMNWISLYRACLSMQYVCVGILLTVKYVCKLILLLLDPHEKWSILYLMQETPDHFTMSCTETEVFIS